MPPQLLQVRDVLLHLLLHLPVPCYPDLPLLLRLLTNQLHQQLRLQRLTLPHIPPLSPIPPHHIDMIHILEVL